DRTGAETVNATLEGLHRELFSESNPIPAKWALNQMGLVKKGIRLPLTWLAEAYHSHVRAAMAQAGLANAASS
ncbi:MAG: dihydrodipicolinate synthase family protein, partial [Gammaproteobacteria bacterium]